MNFYDFVVKLTKERLAEEGEAPTNAAGTGQVAGLGVGAQGEPPGKTALIKRLSMLKRKKPNVSLDRQ